MPTQLQLSATPIGREMEKHKAFLKVLPAPHPDNVVDLQQYFTEPLVSVKFEPSPFEQATFVQPPKKRYGVYAGSFNPFHKGHLNIAFQASALFDEVEIVQGRNPEKAAPTCDLAALRSIHRFRIGKCEGLLTDYIEENYAGKDVTLIRGLRNSLDLQAEINQTRYYQDLMPTLKIIYLLCDREFEHVSSSAIRTLALFGKEGEYIVT